MFWPSFFTVDIQVNYEALRRFQVIFEVLSTHISAEESLKKLRKISLCYLNNCELFLLFFHESNSHGCTNSLQVPRNCDIFLDKVFAVGYVLSSKETLCLTTKYHCKLVFHDLFCVMVTSPTCTVLPANFFFLKVLSVWRLITDRNLDTDYLR